MVGNDVVDLGDAEVRSGATHPRFDARVFAPSETAALATSGAPNRLRWLLWAAKEAAYKLGVKQTPELVFSPQRFVVEIDPKLEGHVRHPEGAVRVQLQTDGDALHAVATQDAGGEVLHGVAVAGRDDDPSSAVRRFAGARIAQHLGILPTALEFGRRGRVPTVHLAGSDDGFDLSLSHHGRYIAFACDLGGTR